MTVRGALAHVRDLDRESAREAAREELRGREYADAQPPLLARIGGWVVRRIGELLDQAAAVAPGGLAGLVALAVLVALLVGVVLTRVGPLARSRAAPGLFDGTGTRTAAEHRELAEAAAQEGRWPDAVRERLRAVVRELEARGALDVRPGRTAGEVARDGGAAVPDVAADLRRAAVVFDEVWYGGRSADAGSYAVVVAVDDQVRDRPGVR